MERLTQRMEADYRDTRNTLESGEFSAELGAILLQQLEAMPDLNSLRQQQAQRRARLASENTRRLAHRAEARRLGDVEAAVSHLHSQLQTGQPPAEQARLRELVTQRLELLDHILEPQEFYFGKAKALDDAEDAWLAVGAELLSVAATLLTLELLSAVCRPRGLAAAHFRWPRPNLRLLRTATRRLTIRAAASRLSCPTRMPIRC